MMFRTRYCELSSLWKVMYVVLVVVSCVAMFIVSFVMLFIYGNDGGADMGVIFAAITFLLFPVMVIVKLIKSCSFGEMDMMK